MSERELEERIQRIAVDLAGSTGKPLRFWLEETARMLARERRWEIHPTPQGDVVVVFGECAPGAVEPPPEPQASS
jgi:hypothetical protein